MARIEISHSAIGNLGDGSAGLEIDRHLKRILEDIDDRPSDKTKRTLTIKIHASPPDPSKNLIDWEVVVDSTVPKVKTSVTRSRFSRSQDGEISAKFSDTSQGEPDQQTFEDTHPGFAAKQQ